MEGCWTAGEVSGGVNGGGASLLMSFGGVQQWYMSTWTVGVILGGAREYLC